MKIEKLYPACMDNVWGGVKLKEKYGKVTEKTPCAESWELSFHEAGKTRISGGQVLDEVVTDDDLGENCKRFEFFPMLIKFIDAKADLSVQVHPSDEYALKNENSYGKTETWYIVEAEKGAGIYLGFNRDVTKEEYEKAIEEKKLTELLNFYEVKAGECYFIPSGTIHAIGAGCLICEIQQNSNLTYRVYDYGRKDKNGKERELHVDKALKVTSLSAYRSGVVSFVDGKTLAECEYFSVTGVRVCGKKTLSTDQGSFACVTCVRGMGTLDGQSVRAGDSFFVPANYGTFEAGGDMDLLVSKVP